MSRIGKKPIPIPKGVKIDFAGDNLSIKGPLGELKRKIDARVNILEEDEQLIISTEGGEKEDGALHGLYRALIANMVKGVSQGFERALDIVGVGYRAELSGRIATLHLGYSHPINFELPDGIDAEIDRTKIKLKGIDKEEIGRTAAKIRSFRPPEPYKGKGIKYAEEVIRRKAGKTGAK
ncbi:MAG: 50S ribosomal protein L6 [Desulfatiglandales bacterium]